MEQTLYTKYHAGQVTESMLEEAAVLFSQNYGVWGEQPTAKFPKPGKLTQSHLAFGY